MRCEGQREASWEGVRSVAWWWGYVFQVGAMACIAVCLLVEIGIVRDRVNLPPVVESEVMTT
jgi:hypothetical protein